MGMRRAFAAVADDKEHIVVVNSFSKTYDMTGWRLGWVQASERAIRIMSSTGIARTLSGHPWRAVRCL